MKVTMGVLKITFLLLFAFLLVVSTDSKATADESKTVIRGVVMPYTWSGKTKLETVAIRVITQLDQLRKKQQDDKISIKDYLVANNERGQELLNLSVIGEEVEAVGKVVPNEAGQPVIHLTNYKRLEEKSKK